MRVLLFSGGIDSTSVAWMERPDALIFIDYGQLAVRGELRAATAVACSLGMPLDVRQTDLSRFGAGTMAGAPPANPNAPEFWPFRNQMLVTLASMAYAARCPVDILIGSVAGDEVHPDGTGVFVDAMNSVLRAQGDFRLLAPALNLSAGELLRRAQVPDEVLGWTFSCHTGEWACGQCRGCLKHDGLKFDRTSQLGPQ